MVSAVVIVFCSQYFISEVLMKADILYIRHSSAQPHRDFLSIFSPLSREFPILMFTDEYLLTIHSQTLQHIKTKYLLALTWSVQLNLHGHNIHCISIANSPSSSHWQDITITFSFISKIVIHKKLFY